MIHNQLTNYAQLLAGFRRMLGEMGGDFSGIERAGETLTPVMDLWALPEWAFLRREILYSRRVGSAAVAARFSTVEFVNPAASGQLAVVDAIQNDFSTVLEVSRDVGLAIAANPVVTQGLARDGRAVDGLVSQCTVTTGDTAAGTANVQVRIPATDLFPYAFIIPPGGKLFISTDAANQAAGLSLHWSERPLLDTERRA